MLRVRVCTANMGAFLGIKFSFGRLSANIGGLSGNWRKMGTKSGSFSTKSHHKCGYDSKFR